MDDARGRATGGAEGDGCGARYAVWDRDTAACDAPVIVNSDAHRPEDLQGLAGQAHTLRVERASRLSDLPRQRQDRQDDSWAWAGAKHGARQGDGFCGVREMDIAGLRARPTSRKVA